MNSRRAFLSYCLSVGAASTAYAAGSQPLRIVVGFPGGDVSDSLARFMAEKMRGALDRPVIVDNRAGAGGIIAAENVKSSPPDGNTLMLAPLATMVTFPHTYDRLRYDPVRDYAPIALAASFDLAIAVRADGPKTLKALSEAASTNPDYRNFASPAAGSLPHFFGLLYGQKSRQELTHISYRGDPPAKQALLGGEIGMMVAPVGAFGELEKAGKIRILATSGARRNALTPTVPTFEEQGLDLVASAWYALYAPAGTPSDLVASLSKAAIAAVNDPDNRRRLADLGLTPGTAGPAALAETMRRDDARWGPVIKASGFKAN